MKLTGQILKESREKQGISLNEVHIALKINSKIIEAIENGDLGKLPSFSFLRGFVQSYARFLKLDVESILTTFNEEMGSNPQLEKKYDTPVEEVATE